MANCISVSVVLTLLMGYPEASIAISIAPTASNAQKDEALSIGFRSDTYNKLVGHPLSLH
jgi:hypothetical protein